MMQQYCRDHGGKPYVERVVLCVLDLSEIRGSTDLFQDCSLFFTPLVRDKEPILWKNGFLYNKSHQLGVS